jgi:hypothetical protein
VTSGGIGVVREHQIQEKKSPTPPFIKGGTTKEEKKKQKS